MTFMAKKLHEKRQCRCQTTGERNEHTCEYIALEKNIFIFVNFYRRSSSGARGSVAKFMNCKASVCCVFCFAFCYENKMQIHMGFDSTDYYLR